MQMEMPTQIKPVREVVTANFVDGAMLSWVAISNTSASLCALRNDRIGSVCYGLAVDLKNIDVKAIPDLGGPRGGIQWIFSGRGKKHTTGLVKTATRFAEELEKTRLKVAGMIDGSDQGGHVSSLIASDSEASCDDSDDEYCVANERDEGGGGSSGPIETGSESSSGNEVDGEIPVIIITGERPSPPGSLPDDPPPPPSNSAWCQVLSCTSEPSAPPPGPTREQCDKIIRACREDGTWQYYNDMEQLPGTGSDYAARLRRYIRECSEREGCFNY